MLIVISAALSGCYLVRDQVPLSHSVASHLLHSVSQSYRCSVFVKKKMHMLQVY